MSNWWEEYRQEKSAREGAERQRDEAVRTLASVQASRGLEIRIAQLEAVPELDPNRHTETMVKHWATCTRHRTIRLGLMLATIVALAALLA